MSASNRVIALTVLQVLYVEGLLKGTLAAALMPILSRIAAVFSFTLLISLTG